MKIQLAVATAAALLSSVNAAVSPLANFAAETADVESVGERKRGHASKGGRRASGRCENCKKRCYQIGGGSARIKDCIKSRCSGRCSGVDPEAIIDLYYETGGLSRLPDDEDFDYYF
mmetsp:Transcript_14106/g.30886  ORF Transcript_14106/g.30886 Transcript_14106/m.30886 type:complete len:117 (-) Transcript_14106:81-431(-)